MGIGFSKKLLARPMTVTPSTARIPGNAGMGRDFLIGWAKSVFHIRKKSLLILYYTGSATFFLVK